MKNTLLLLFMLCSVSTNCQAIIIDSNQQLNDMLQSFGILDHPELTVTSAELNFGEGSSKINSGLSNSINSMDYAITNYLAQQVLISTASSGKKQGEAGFVLPNSIGNFTNASGTYDLPAQGIVLSSGDVDDYEDGPNTTGSNTTAWGNEATTDQEDLLSQVTGPGSDHFDVTELTINFDVGNNVDTLSFLAAFASEEFSSYQGSIYNDGFGLFLNGQNIAASVSDGLNQADTINISHLDMAAVTGTELDGAILSNNSPLLRFESSITSGSTDNELTLIVADRADQLFDTTVYLSMEHNISTTIPADNKGLVPGTNIRLGNKVYPVPCNVPVCLIGISSSGKKYKSTGAAFQSIAMPSLTLTNDLDGFELWVWDGFEFLFEQVLFADDIFDFTTINASGVGEFQIRDIDPPVPIDLNDPRAFMLGANFMSDITANNLSVSLIDEPPLVLAILIAIVMIIRRRNWIH